jgi:hypothetical protein
MPLLSTLVFILILRVRYGSLRFPIGAERSKYSDFNPLALKALVTCVA